MSGTRSNRSLAARRGRPYDKGRGFAAQALWVAVSDADLHPGVVSRTGCDARSCVGSAPRSATAC